MTEWPDVARGLVAGWLIDQVDARGDLPLWIGAVISFLGLAAAVVAGGFVRGLGIVLVLVGLIVVLVVLLIRAVARSLIRRFADPTSLAGKQRDIDRVLRSSGLPTGPLAIIGLVSRLRRHAPPEVERLNGVMDDLQSELARTELARTELADPDVEGGVTEGVTDPGSSRPELSE